MQVAGVARRCQSTCMVICCCYVVNFTCVYLTGCKVAPFCVANSNHTTPLVCFDVLRVVVLIDYTQLCSVNVLCLPRSVPFLKAMHCYNAFVQDYVRDVAPSHLLFPHPQTHTHTHTHTTHTSITSILLAFNAICRNQEYLLLSK